MTERIPLTEKPCTRCKEVKPASAFSRNASMKSGLMSHCKTCNAAAMRERRAKDPEANRAAQRAWRRAADPERLAESKAASRQRNLAAARERDRLYRERNAERIAAYHRDYNKRKLAERLEKNRRWLAANPEKKAEYALRRRALKAGTKVGPVNLAALWTGDCGLCGLPINPDLKRPDVMSKSVDHIVPLSLGGAHSQGNLQWTHLSCNLSKGNRM